MIIAIDGPAASGKSTIAREVAKKLNYRFVSTGAMYRALTYLVLKEKIDVYNEKSLASIAKKYHITFKKSEENPNKEKVIIDSQDVTDCLFTPKVDSSVSFVARSPGVREELVKQQRQLSKQGDVVMEGRDIGSVVLPKADYKIFLTASARERARRRKQELEKSGHICDEDSLKRQLIYRDKIDASRKVSPLVKAAGAFLIDTTDKTIDQVIDMVMEIVGKQKTKS